jgi:hypothetical protein
MKKQLLLTMCAVAATSIMIMSCKKNGVTNPSTLNTSKSNFRASSLLADVVYVGGFQFNSANDYAKYWINTTGYTLTSGTPTSGGDVYDIDVASTGDVFAIGTSNIYATRGTVWKNSSSGVYQLPVPTGAIYAEPRMVYINGSDVYIAGNTAGGTAGRRATYWKFSVGSPSSISVNVVGTASATTGSDAFGVTIVGTDVYVVGNLSAPGYAQGDIVYWKNGVQTSLPGPILSTRPQIVSIGSDVYIGVVTVNPATLHLFKNGVALPISGGPTERVSAIDLATDGTKLDVIAPGTDNPSAYVNTIWIWDDVLVNTTPTSSISAGSTTPCNTSYNCSAFGPSGNLFIGGRLGVSTTAGGYWEVVPSTGAYTFTSVSGTNNTITGLTVR